MKKTWYKKAQEWTEGDGDCMQVAANLMMRYEHSFFPGGKWDPGGEPSLVHALVRGRGKADGHRFPHAWVEVGDTVYDHSSGVDRKIPKMLYYILGGIDPEEKGSFKKYNLEEMRKKLLSTGHYGPWDLDESLQETPNIKNTGKARNKKASSYATLGDLVKLGIGMRDADFWIVRRSSADLVGKPKKEFDPEAIGVKVIDTDVLDPQYLYYTIMHVANTGHFKKVARGSTRLVSIRISDIADISLSRREE